MERCQVIKQMIGGLEGSCEFTDLKSPLILSIFGFYSHSISMSAGWLLSNWHKEGRSGKQEYQLKNCIHQTGVLACFWGIFLINEWRDEARPILDSATPGQVDLGYIRE